VRLKGKGQTTTFGIIPLYIREPQFYFRSCATMCDISLWKHLNIKHKVETCQVEFRLPLFGAGLLKETLVIKPLLRWWSQLSPQCHSEKFYIINRSL